MNESSEVIFKSREIQKRISQLASQISQEYKDKNPILIGILQGSFILLADLSRALWRKGIKDFEVDFMGIASYGKNTESSKNPKITKDIGIDVRGRHIILIEDLIDTGWSLDSMRRLLLERNPASLKILVLLSKTARREIEVSVDYVGFEVLENAWVEGYGMDTNLKGRGRPDIIKRF